MVKITFDLHINNPEIYEAIANGQKNAEGRLLDEKRQKIVDAFEIDEVYLKFISADDRVVERKLLKVEIYSDFYLMAENYEDLLFPDLGKNADANEVAGKYLEIYPGRTEDVVLFKF